MSKAFRTKLLFEKYIKQTCTHEELEELFELFNNQSNKEAVESYLEDYWEKINSITANQLSFEYQFEKFKDKIKEQEVSYLPVRKNLNIGKWAVAACLLVGIAFASIYYTNPPEPSPIQTIATTVKPHALRKIILSDGTTVLLKSGSHLTYPQKFGLKSREVYLTGEGYFDVIHNQKRPFLVHTGNLTTKVLGTAFNIKTSDNESLVQVTVTRGKVAVANAKRTLAVLLPNQQINYNAKVDSYIQQKTNAKITVLWKEEDLVLNDMTLNDAVNLLKERYGTNITLESETIKQCKFTAYFLNTTNLAQVVKVISNLNHLKYEQSGDGSYKLTGNGCE